MYDGETIVSPQIGVISENTILNEIISSGSSVSIRFIAPKHTPIDIKISLQIDSSKLPFY